MTPAEHYLNAESLLSTADTADGGSDLEDYCLKVAAVHAQLALVGATVMTASRFDRSAACDLLNVVSK